MASVTNPTVSLNRPFDYATEQDALMRRQKYADILNEEAMQPLKPGSYQGIEAPISPLSGLAKILQGAGAGYMQGQATADKRDFEARRQQDLINFAEALSFKPSTSPINPSTSPSNPPTSRGSTETPNDFNTPTAVNQFPGRDRSFPFNTMGDRNSYGILPGPGGNPSIEPNASALAQILTSGAPNEQGAGMSLGSVGNLPIVPSAKVPNPGASITQDRPPSVDSGTSQTSMTHGQKMSLLYQAMGGPDPSKAAVAKQILANMQQSEEHALTRLLKAESDRRHEDTQRENARDRIAAAAQAAKDRNAILLQGLDFKREALLMAAEQRREAAQLKRNQVPVRAVQEYQKSDSAYVSAGTNADRLRKIRADIDSGKLALGPVTNAQYRARNYLGVSTPESENFATMQRDLLVAANNILLLAKGTQTEGDAQRARDQILASPNDSSVVSGALADLINVSRKLQNVYATTLNQLGKSFPGLEHENQPLVPVPEDRVRTQTSQGAQTGAQPMPIYNDGKVSGTFTGNFDKNGLPIYKASNGRLFVNVLN